MVTAASRAAAVLYAVTNESNPLILFLRVRGGVSVLPMIQTGWPSFDCWSE